MLGSVNPVAAPHFNFTMPEPTGVVGVIAPDEPDVLGLVAEILPPLAAGNVVVAIVSERWPLLSLHVGEVLGVADVPAGVVNLISGPALRARQAAGRPPRRRRDRSTRRATPRSRGWPPTASRAWRTARRRLPRRRGLDSLSRIEPFVELKTAWHPVGT